MPVNLKVAAAKTRDLLKQAQYQLGPIYSGDPSLSLEHLIEMLDKLESGEIDGEKGHRWLGWAQCLMCARDVASLEDLKIINKSSKISQEAG